MMRLLSSSNVLLFGMLLLWAAMLMPPTVCAAEKPLTKNQALDRWDSLETVTNGFLIGTWRGENLPTGHPIDGFLAMAGWYGKIFLDEDTVHPLVFYTAFESDLFYLDPGKLAFWFTRIPKIPWLLRSLILLAKPFLATTTPGAHLEMLTYRGRDTAAMVYNDTPVIDYFVRVDANTVLGVMEDEREDDPWFFYLRRVED